MQIFLAEQLPALGVCFSLTLLLSLFPQALGTLASRPAFPPRALSDTFGTGTLHAVRESTVSTDTASRERKHSPLSAPPSPLRVTAVPVRPRISQVLQRDSQAFIGNVLPAAKPDPSQGGVDTACSRSSIQMLLFALFLLNLFLKVKTI